jgi:hypothetical protein
VAEAEGSGGKARIDFLVMTHACLAFEARKGNSRHQYFNPRAD